MSTMAITAADVNKLRQITGAGMMDCKQALNEANGDFDAAKRQDTEATAALYGLRVTWPEDFPSWYLPGRTTLIVCTPLSEPAS